MPIKLRTRENQASKPRHFSFRLLTKQKREERVENPKMPPKKKQQREEKPENPKIPPKKKTNTSSVSSTSSSTKKPIPQPSKYGIQHFFDRHTIQHSQKQQAINSTSQVDSVSLPPPEKPDNGKATSGPSSQDVTPDNLVLPVANDPTEVSPEMSKSMSRKRFKFSPGMVTYF